MGWSQKSKTQKDKKQTYIFEIFENCCSNLKFAKPTLKASEYWGLVSLSQLGITHLDLGTATEKVDNY